MNKKTIVNIWNWRPLPVVLACAIALSACQGVPSAPEHKYYRLLSAPVGAHTLRLSGEVAVRPLRADGLYGERSIVYSDDQQRQLQQYHYHHWLYAPGQLVQEHLAEVLRGAGTGALIRLQEYGGGENYAVSGRVVRFEKISDAGQAKASAVLELRLEKKGQVLLERNYAASENVAGTTMSGFTAAMEVALNRIYGEFLGDLARIKLD
jgi:ABC-type uncharacterized transport system auxiliary subunit